MGEVRAAFAIARKDVQTFSRYRISVASMVFTPLYQFIVPAFLFGAAFAVNGRAAGLSATLGTDDLPGFIFLGGVVAGLISIAFWGCPCRSCKRARPSSVERWAACSGSRCRRSPSG